MTEPKRKETRKTRGGMFEGGRRVFPERRTQQTPEEEERAAHEGGYVLAGIVLMIIALVIWAALTGTLKP